MNNKRKRAFTLVEILAVIVVLGIILVMVMPSITKIVDNSKLGTIKSSAKLLASSAENYYRAMEVSGEVVSKIITGEDCKELGNIDEKEYDISSCKIEIDNNGVATVTLKGKANGKFDGMTCSGTRSSMTCQKGELSDKEDSNQKTPVKLVTPVLSYIEDNNKIELNKVQNVDHYDFYDGNTKIFSINANGVSIGTSIISAVNDTNTISISLVDSSGNRINEIIANESNIKVKAVPISSSLEYLESDFSNVIDLNIQVVSSYKITLNKHEEISGQDTTTKLVIGSNSYTVDKHGNSNFTVGSIVDVEKGTELDIIGDNYYEISFFKINGKCKVITDNYSWATSVGVVDGINTTYTVTSEESFKIGYVGKIIIIPEGDLNISLGYYDD